MVGCVGGESSSFYIVISWEVLEGRPRLAMKLTTSARYLALSEVVGSIGCW